MNPFDLYGSWFAESPDLSTKRVKTWLSEDGCYLAVIFSHGEGLFQVEICERTKDQWLIGTWWTEVGSRSLTDTQEAAERLATEKLQTLASGQPLDSR